MESTSILFFLNRTYFIVFSVEILAIWQQTAMLTSDVSTVDKLDTCRGTALQGETVEFVDAYTKICTREFVSELCNKHRVSLTKLSLSFIIILIILLSVA